MLLSQLVADFSTLEVLWQISVSDDGDTDQTSRLSAQRTGNEALEAGVLISS